MPSNLATKKHKHSQAALERMTMAVLRGDMSIPFAAEQHGYHVGTVRRYVREARAELSDVDAICVAIAGEIARGGRRGAI